MARIFFTGSSTGLGLLASQRLARESHAIVLHARNERRVDDARQVLRSAEDVIVGDQAARSARSPFDARGLDATGGQAGQAICWVDSTITGVSVRLSISPLSSREICASNVSRSTMYIPPRAPSKPQFQAARA